MDSIKPSYDELLAEIAKLKTQLAQKKEIDNAIDSGVENHRFLFENIKLGVVYQNTKGEIIDANNAAESILGLSLEQMQGRSSVDSRWKAMHENGQPFPGDEHPGMVSLKTGKPVINKIMIVHNPQKNSFSTIKIDSFPRFRNQEEKPYMVVAIFEDITDLRKVENEVIKAKEIAEENETKFQLMISNSPDTIIIQDLDGITTYVSPQVRELTGFDQTYFLGKQIPIDHIFSDDVDKCFEAFNALKNGNEIINLEYRFYRQNNKLIWVNHTARPILKNGEIYGIQNNIRDITLRKHIEIELTNAKEKAEENERQLKKSQQVARIGYYIFNIIKGTWESSEMLDELFGINSAYQKTVEGWLNIVCPDDRKMMLNYLSEHVLKNKQEFNKRYRITNVKTGQNLWVHGIGELKFDESGNPVEMFGTIQDINDRIGIENELILTREVALKYNEQLTNALKIGKMGAWELDILTGLFTFSDSFYSMLRTSASEMGGYQMSIGEYSKRFVHPDDAPMVGEETRKAIESTDPNFNNYVEHRIIYADGTPGYIAVRFFIVKDITGRTVRTYGVNQDITQRKQMEIELIKAKEKAEENDRLKTAFLQNMSHEIRTPLNAISGFSGMLTKPELSEEKRRNFVSIIRNSSQQLISIVSNILTISSVETKQEKLNIAKVCVNDLILELLTIFRQQASNQNLSLYAKQGLTDSQSEIYTDKTKLNQILSNLLSNALKFTHKGFIEFGYVLKMESQPAVMEFYVRDTGIGIKTEYHEKIFERFRQADKSINKLYGGTGLGLAISKAFVELMGGEIKVESEPEKGATFYFTVPYNPVNEPLHSEVWTEIDKNRKTILVAEDEEYNYLFIEELLIDLDLRLIHAKNGKETVEICQADPNIALILMDIKMPVLDGYEAAKIIKEMFPSLPVVAQSAYALEHERAKYSGVFDDYITKPIDGDELIKKVQKFLFNDEF